MKSTVIFLFTFGIAYLLQAQNPCIYLAYESMSGTANTAINGTSSGTGWASAWTVQNANQVVPGYQYNMGSLSYGNLQTIGNSGAGGYVYLTAGRRLNTADGGVFDSFVASNQNGIGTQLGDSLWVSTLVRKEINNSEPVFVSFHSDNLDWCDNCGNNKIAVGYFGTSSDVNGQKRWSVRVGTTVYPTTEVVNIGTAAFFAVKIVFNPNATALTAYINPSSLATPPASPTFTHTMSMNLLIRSVAAYMGSAPGNGSFDEIRVARTYSCVAPDNTVNVNLPPLASFTMSATSGTSPVTVNLNGSTSSDPENAPLTYTCKNKFLNGRS